MKLFYNHNWIPPDLSISLLLVKVPDPAKIKSLEDLMPYVRNDLIRLIENEKHPVRIIQNLMPELERYVVPGDSPDEIANLLLSCDLFSSNISAIQNQIIMGSENISSQRPENEELEELYKEKSLYSFIECLFRIY
ncbi:MAG: hypothetical protein ACNA8K_17150 [Cyclonatronaceae bacterium]